MRGRDTTPKESLSVVLLLSGIPFNEKIVFKTFYLYFILNSNIVLVSDV